LKLVCVMIYLTAKVFRDKSLTNRIRKLTWKVGLTDELAAASQKNYNFTVCLTFKTSGLKSSRFYAISTGKFVYPRLRYAGFLHIQILAVLFERVVINTNEKHQIWQK